MDVSAEILRDIAGARARESSMLLIELCGVFWIAAEMIILFFVIEARRHVGRSPLPAAPVWDRAATRRAVIFALAVFGVLGTVVIRPMVWAPLSARLRSGSLDLSSAAMHDFFAVHRHLVVWVAFVTVWVVLEAAIVYQGYRAYRLFRNRILVNASGLPGTRRVRHSTLALLLLVALAAVGMFAAPAFAAQAVVAPSPKSMNAWSQVLLISESWLFPYRNAVYLYLRLAGVVWISVEWIAAVVLWRAHLLVHHALRARRGLS